MSASAPSTLSHPLPEDVVTVIARRFQVLGEPIRIKVLDQLRGGEASVGELASRLGTSQQNISKHLGILLGERIVGRRKDGTSVRYWIADETVLALCELVCGGMERDLRALLEVVSAARERPHSPTSSHP